MISILPKKDKMIKIISLAKFKNHDINVCMAYGYNEKYVLANLLSNKQVYGSVYE